ncbi:MAG TPA: hypothetical protein VFS95_14390 [Telluria sp.]|nr:hypothetical protein [Telluria sp.]
MNIKSQHTNPGLLAAITESMHRKPSVEEIHNQRISFIIGSMKPNSPVTREKIERVLAEQEGRIAA